MNPTITQSIYECSPTVLLVTKNMHVSTLDLCLEGKNTFDHTKLHGCHRPIFRNQNFLIFF